MALKEEINYIKNELSTEEKFFESFFKIEKFYKKHKIKIISLIGLIIIIITGYSINNYLEKKRILRVNQAYNEILANKNIEKNLKILKEDSPILYKIALYKTAKAKNIDLTYLKELTKLQNAFNNNDLKTINNLILSNDLLLKDYAIYYKAVLLTYKKEYKKAKNILEQIPQDSVVNELKIPLIHYLVAKE